MIDKKIVVIGLGYVGLAYALLLSEDNKVYAVDINEEKINKLKEHISPINTEEFNVYISHHKYNRITYLVDINEINEEPDFVIIATSTDYDENNNSFNVSSVKDAINNVKKWNNAKIIIKSTIPVGFCESFKMDNLFFSPEFLREDNALRDIMIPSRIIIGGNEDDDVASLFTDLSVKSPISVVFTTPSEAEAIKLFSNAYLAMRVAFFNEVDTFALEKGLDTKKLIKGICLDERIGNHYNNPSFGYGGYCLPKDTKQLKSNFKDIPSSLINAIVDANKTRKQYIAKTLLEIGKDKTIGIYRLSMKKGSDNYRNSSINDIISELTNNGYNIVIYEPTYKQDSYMNAKINNDLLSFKKEADIIVANRIDNKLEDVKNKLFTRDIFSRD